ncbi:hypothetical protein B0H13DRAFT_2031890 [Mycena leptocephala]|nr:hypothetical protein B0H13DRAFT_2031890 [Mycena leptocephala]
MTITNEKLSDEKREQTPEQVSQEGPVGSTQTPVPFEAYLYFAALQRSEEEKSASYGDRFANSLVDRLSATKGPTHREVPLSERATASRALRLASWSSVFYLITTDVLGPFNAPFAISQVGWVPVEQNSQRYLPYSDRFLGHSGPDCIVYGALLWRLFIRLDSLRYPIMSYADIVERIFGTRARRVSTVLQSVQLVVIVGIICLANAQALVQIAKHHICFSVCIVIWALIGMVIGQIRTLKGYAWLANGAVWLNLLLIFTSMGFVAHSPPNFAAAFSSLGEQEGPVQTELFAKIPLFSQVNGIMNMVYAYGGAMIFPEIMSEMRRPMDFWKGMILAQSLIFSAYLVYGAFVYSQQGQFVLPLAYQGVSRYAWQTFGIIAAGLYGNIGIKVVYHNIIEDWYDGPPLLSTKGRYIWSTMVCLYWSLAFIIGSAIPQIQTINGLIGAIGVMQFTYTFPPLLRFGYDVISDAMVADKPYDVKEGCYRRIDSWNQWSRWKRGLFSGRWYFKLFNFLLFLASLAMAGLGMWAAGETVKATFALSGSATSFSCRAPV